MPIKSLGRPNPLSPVLFAARAHRSSSLDFNLLQSHMSEEVDPPYDDSDCSSDRPPKYARHTPSSPLGFPTTPTRDEDNEDFLGGLGGANPENCSQLDNPEPALAQPGLWPRLKKAKSIHDRVHGQIVLEVCCSRQSLHPTSAARLRPITCPLLSVSPASPGPVSRRDGHLRVPASRLD